MRLKKIIRYIYIYTPVHTYIQGSPAEIRTPTRWGLMGRNVNAQQYSPATLGHSAFISARRALKRFIVSVL